MRSRYYVEPHGGQPQGHLSGRNLVPAFLWTSAALTLGEASFEYSEKVVCILHLFQCFTIKNLIDKNVSKTYNYVMRKVTYRQSSSRGDDTTTSVAWSEAQHEWTTYTSLSLGDGSVSWSTDSQHPVSRCSAVHSRIVVMSALIHHNSHSHVIITDLVDLNSAVHVVIQCSAILDSKHAFACSECVPKLWQAPVSGAGISVSRCQGYERVSQHTDEDEASNIGRTHLLKIVAEPTEMRVPHLHRVRASFSLPDTRSR